MKKPLSTLLVVFSLVILSTLILRPRWYLNLTKRVEVSPQVGAALVEKYGCRKCHIVEGRGALKAPNLDEVAKRESTETLYRWLANPRSMRANTPMPNFHLSDSEIEAIIAYLRSLR
ncbi:MAG: c-type cytochrome [Anaerolineales bacterium]